MIRLELAETRVQSPHPLSTTRPLPLFVSVIALPPLSLQHVAASSHLAHRSSCWLWRSSRTSSSTSWSCPGTSVFWKGRIGHDLNQHTERLLHAWTLYMTTAGIGVTSIQRAPRRSGIAYPLGAARSCAGRSRAPTPVRRSRAPTLGRRARFLRSLTGVASAVGQVGQYCSSLWPAGLLYLG